MMRIYFGFCLWVSAICGPVPAALAASNAEALDLLFERLQSAASAEEAASIDERINEILATHESPTADLLFNRAMESYELGNAVLSVELFTALTGIEPHFAEAWHLKGQVQLELGNYEDALLDFQRALALEPRHYVALTGAAAIFESFGDKKRALEAISRARAINPQMEDLRDWNRRLSRDVEGQGI